MDRPWIKFKKNREVDRSWMHVPAKYMSEVKGSNSKGHCWEGKEFCIIEFYGNRALCGWRNNETCKVGKTFLCKIVRKGKKTGIIYKDKFYQLGRYGWVI